MKPSINSFLTRSIILIFVLITVCFNSKAQTPETSKFITVDQFGYLPDSKKVAVIRNPVIGYDSLETFIPGSVYPVVNSETKEQVFNGTPVIWQNGATDASSGDKVWWFDFSTLKSVGNYYVLDVDSNLGSYEFEIREDIYSSVLVQAERTFFYQRSGFAKQATFAGSEWADEASHLQDKTVRDFLKKGDAKTQTITGKKDPYLAHIKDYTWGNENSTINIKNLHSGNYIVILSGDDGIWQTKFLKL